MPLAPFHRQKLQFKRCFVCELPKHGLLSLHDLCHGDTHTTSTHSLTLVGIFGHFDGNKSIDYLLCSPHISVLTSSTFKIRSTVRFFALDQGEKKKLITSTLCFKQRDLGTSTICSTVRCCTRLVISTLPIPPPLFKIGGTGRSTIPARDTLWKQKAETPPRLPP